MGYVMCFFWNRSKNGSDTSRCINTVTQSEFFFVCSTAAFSRFSNSVNAIPQAVRDSRGERLGRRGRS